MKSAPVLSETEAREIVLVQAFDQAAGPLWTAEDREWASRLALQAAGAKTAPQAFLVERARHALQRLRPRDAALARWLTRPAWKALWLAVALVVGLLCGALLDSLGGSQRINLLAPPVWGTISWNLLVYAGLLASLTRPAWAPLHALRRWLQSRLLPARAGCAPLQQAQMAWREYAAPLAAQRAAALLHNAAAALALGLIAGMYLRGLVLDFRVGWQSTFLTASAVHDVLATLLAPATALTGIVVPEAVVLEALRITPATPEATASAAPWIHLYATMLALFVIVPRAVLAGAALWQAATLSRHFPLPLGAAYFQQLLARQRGGVARVQVLPHAAVPRAQAVLGLRALLAPVLGEDMQLRVAEVVAYGDEERALPAADQTSALRVALFDLAATPEAENHGLFVQALRDAVPATPLLIVVDETPWCSRFGAMPERLAQRRSVWKLFAEQLGVGVLCADLDEPDVAAIKPTLQRLLAH